MPDPIERLASIFEKFPGIGPRQAGRFVQFVLRSSPGLRRDFIEALKDISSAAHPCSHCQRFHSDSEAVCSICRNPSRDSSLLTIVASDADVNAIENSHVYKGYYFVIGGTMSLASERPHILREDRLRDAIERNASKGLSEIVLALPANPEGDFTALHLKGTIAPLAQKYNIRVSMLGRGLSTGSELEYADPQTLKNAFEGRK